MGTANRYDGHQYGMRQGEIFSLTWFDVDLSRGLFHIRVSKNGKDRFASTAKQLRRRNDKRRIIDGHVAFNLGECAAPTVISINGGVADNERHFYTVYVPGDVALRDEVESLITSHNSAGDSIEIMAAEAARKMLSAEHGSIEGKQIGHYHVLSRIGRGGMGEVFLSQDTRLGRKVALKLLRSDLTGNEDRLRRFQQEARAASALSHPNILTIYEIGSENSAQFMAAEYVEGETLRQRMAGGKDQIQMTRRAANGAIKRYRFIEK